MEFDIGSGSGPSINSKINANKSQISIIIEENSENSGELNKL